MAKIRLAICDRGVAYRERFAEYLAKHRSEEMEVYAFSKDSVFLDMLETIAFHVVLLGAGFEQFIDCVRKKEIPVIVLMENAISYVTEDSEFGQANNVFPIKNGQGEIFYTSKYQSMDDMLQKVYMMADRKREKVGTGHLTGMDVIGVYSPIGHEMQLPYSWLYALELAKYRRVLYLNFMEYAGLEELLCMDYDYNLGNVILALRSDNLSAEGFRRCVYEMGELSYVPPFHNPENVHEVRVEDYVNLIDFLEEYFDYDTIVVHFGAGMDKLSKLLVKCREVHCLIKEGYFYKCQLRQFSKYLSATVEEEELEKINMIDLPFSAGNIFAGTSFMEQITWSEFGDFVRKKV